MSSRGAAAPGGRATSDAAAAPRGASSGGAMRFLDPAVLAAISGLDLVAQTVVEGFIAGLHRSADFGFSQEFAEYRAYVPGDDLRHVDWNAFARTERLYLKRWRGETSSVLTVLLDASNSMSFASHAVRKADYARFLAASLCYLAIRKQRDAAGLVVFDDEVRDYIRPSTRQGQLFRVLAALEQAEPRARTRLEAPLKHVEAFVRRRGIIVVLSDFYEPPAAVVRAIEPLRHRGSEVVLFHVLDREELQLEIGGSSVLVDLESGARFPVTQEYAARDYRERITAHCKELEERAGAAGLGYRLLQTSQPLDAALREYLAVRQGRD
ncbi:MAG TPA: DUF58 domain-containing protein [Steroidobacteraceae bacterium]|nr:DUF58 domain-containing protein [Steroidobacteraceae bacterium]